MTAERRSAPGRAQLDDRILKHVASTDWASPRTMESRQGFDRASAGRIEERCCLLEYAELIAVAARKPTPLAVGGSA
jgi:hypothetical protein